MKILTVTCDDASNFDAIKEAGADEVILPLQDGCFSSLKGFSMEEIETICQKKTIRVSVLMNRLFPQNEMKEVEEKLTRLLKCADAILFADPAIAFLASQQQAMDHLIYCPETLMTSSEDAKFWMKQGLQSIQISSLLTVEEILGIAKVVPHTTLQIHGSLLMSVSKRPLLSSYGKNIQNDSFHEKRDLYLQEMKRDGMMPIYENDYGTMIYSDYVQESFEYMKAFMEAGIERFEISSNGLSKEAFLDAIKNYRAILDGKQEDGSAYMQQYASIPFSTGYYGQKTVK